MKELIVTGHTVEEAVALACEQLGVTQDDITYEVLELPAKKLFGQSPAKVKVSCPEESVRTPALEEFDSVPADEKPAAEKPYHTAPKSYADRPAQRGPRPEKKPREAVAPEVPDVEIEESEIPETAKANLEYLRQIVEKLVSSPITYRFYKTETGVKFALDGEDSAILIGRRGETMEALQYLCSLSGSHGEKKYVKVSLDVAGYRSKREASLVSLANRMGAKVLKTRRSQTLQPMNPYERRIVHSAVQHISGVTSESVGEDPNRRIVISPEGRGRYNNDSRKDRYSGKKPSGAARPAAPAQPTAAAVEKKSEQVDAGALYTKIEF